MNEIKRKIIAWLAEDNYTELESTEQVCFATISKMEVFKITYENGNVDYVTEHDDKVITFNK